MKVCIPTMGDKGNNEYVGEHFGRVPTYTLVDTKTNEVTVFNNTSEHAGGSGYPPEIIAQTGAEVMLCGGLGRRAVTMFEEIGIMVRMPFRCGRSASSSQLLTKTLAGNMLFEEEGMNTVISIKLTNKKRNLSGAIG